MRVDWWMDERRDPARATDGAIKFLGYLQRQFGSLYLAAAAYNGGPGRVARGLTRFADEMEGAECEDRFFALAFSALALFADALTLGAAFALVVFAAFLPAFLTIDFALAITVSTD